MRTIRVVSTAILTVSLASVSVASAQSADPMPIPADPSAAVELPAGFQLKVFASDLPRQGRGYTGPRFMTFGPDGNLYLSLGRGVGRVVMLPDSDGDSRADEVVTVIDGLEGPQGLAFRGDTLFVATTSQILRLRNPDGAWPADGYDVVVDGLPGGGRHPMKTLEIGPDGYFYVTAGSSCNACIEEDPRRGGILRYAPDGRAAGAEGLPDGVYAIGLRNPEGFDWHPETGDMYASNNGTDRLGDTTPREEINRIVEGGHYGWPHCYEDRVPDTNFGGTPEDCADTRTPAITLAAHSAPLGITFYDADRFPAEYRGDLFVAQHGSWNRSDPVGYKISRIVFEDGQPVRVEAFLTGFLVNRSAWSRPVDVVVGPEGRLFISDDRGGMVYVIDYNP